MSNRGKCPPSPHSGEDATMRSTPKERSNVLCFMSHLCHLSYIFCLNPFLLKDHMSVQTSKAED